MMVQMDVWAVLESQKAHVRIYATFLVLIVFLMW